MHSIVIFVTLPLSPYVSFSLSYPLQKEAERFRRLLKDPETVQELDRTSGPKAAKGSKQLSWDSVFR